MRMKSSWLAVTALAGVLSLARGSGAAEHPYMLWTRDEAAALKRRIDTDPEAKLQYAKMVQRASSSGCFRNLFDYLVLGDERAGEREKKLLLGFIGTHPDRAPVKRAHYDCYESALRYDVLYDALSVAERRGVENTFRAYIDHQLRDRKRYTRTSWLPNMQWPRPMAAHLMAVALGDRDLILKLIRSNGGWKWYFDEYVADGFFYFEEFGKHYSMIGEMLLFCRGLERLGMNEWGYGYVGRLQTPGKAGGATMKNYLLSIPRVGYPRISLGTDRYHYPKVTMGDASGCPRALSPPSPPKDPDEPDAGAALRTGYHYVLQHDIVTGYLPHCAGGNEYWTAKNMNGRDHRNQKVPKMMTPLWFEMAHARWPDAGFDYFLAQMREPDEATYSPTLYFGLEPIDPAKVAPPPAPSYVAKERGFVMLRADESRAYWEGEAPAVAFNLGVYYVHFVRDYFSLLGLYAFNRPVYVNRNISTGYATGDPWTGWGHGKCTVLVDRGLPVDRGIGEVPVRSGFHGPVKFAAATGTGRYEGVTETRALFLTREYLFDIARLASGDEHTYDWQVHALGSHQPEQPGLWQGTDDLDGGRLYGSRTSDRLSRRHDLHDVEKLEAGEAPWGFRAVQDCRLDDPAKGVLGSDWYAKRVGVAVRMLGGEPTTVYVGKTPTHAEPDEFREPEIGGVSLIARRRGKRATFVALHEPFKNGRPRIVSVEPIAQTSDAVAAKVVGEGDSGVNDRAMVALGQGIDRPRTIGSAGETFTFTDYAFVRVGSEKVEVCGGLEAMKVRVEGRPGLTVNGSPVPARVEGGFLMFGP